MTPKSTFDQIRERFDKDVERFSNLETGQSATMDAPLVLELIAGAAKAATPHAKHLLDIGCGAGNYTVRLLKEFPAAQCSLLDLSLPMLDRAQRRIIAAGGFIEHVQQQPLQQVLLQDQSADIIVAAAVLHHLRDDGEWENAFAKLYRALKPGGSLWIADLIEHTSPGIQQMMWKRYGDYLTGLKDEAYRDHVFSYIEKEDSPRPLMYQLNLLQKVGFEPVDVLHKNGCFAAFGGIKPK